MPPTRLAMVWKVGPTMMAQPASPDSNHHPQLIVEAERGV